MPAFLPTAQHRTFVSAVAGMRMTQEEIASIIQDPRTGQPISVPTLRKYFQHELETGRQRLKPRKPEPRQR